STASDAQFPSANPMPTNVRISPQYDGCRTHRYGPRATTVWPGCTRTSIVKNPPSTATAHCRTTIPRIISARPTTKNAHRPSTIAATDRAIDFYVGTLGFEKVVDVPMGEAMRWVEVALPGTATTIALAPPPQEQEVGGTQTGICLDTSNVDADHAALKAAGVDVDEEVTRWGDPVPPMFWLRDPDGNSLIIVQPTA